MSVENNAMDAAVKKPQEEEVDAKLRSVRENTSGPGKGRGCPFCPFRAFQRRAKMLAPMHRYHCKERLFTASTVSQARWNKVVSMHNQMQATAVPGQVNDDSKLLERSAQFLREWNALDATSLKYMKKQNDVEVVLCLSETGPKYKLRSQTQGFRRFNQDVYYDNEIANLILSLTLKHRAKTKSAC